MLVVMSNAENAGGLVLSASPMAKKVLGVSNVTRKNQVPAHPDLYVVPPRMNLYMKKIKKSIIYIKSSSQMKIILCLV